MNRRTAHATTKTPARTGGEDRPEPACDQSLVDAVYAGGKAANYARPRILSLCGACQLRDACWADPLWRVQLRGSSVPETPERKAASERNRNRIDEKWTAFHEARRTEIEAVIARGGNLDEALAVLKVTKDALLKWCRSQERPDLWAALGGHPVQRKARVAACGTPAGRIRHQNKRERVCDACREAHNSARRERYQRKAMVAA